MTQEDKQLILKDLCARLPYGVRVKISDKDILLVENNEKGTLDGKETINDDNFVIKCDKNNWIISCDGFKPYLRPMSSMTEEEEEEYAHLLWLVKKDRINLSNDLGTRGAEYVIDWLNAHHFDYRGLIKMGLALEAPKGMYNKKESEKVSDIPIPKTVDEAVKTLAKIVSEEDRDYLLENGAISMHDSLGRWIRNEWGLWTDSELKNELKKKGFEHPDDMSNHIIEEFVKYCLEKM